MPPSAPYHDHLHRRCPSSHPGLISLSAVRCAIELVSREKALRNIVCAATLSMIASNISMDYSAHQYSWHYDELSGTYKRHLHGMEAAIVRWNTPKVSSKLHNQNDSLIFPCYSVRRSLRHGFQASLEDATVLLRQPAQTVKSCLDPATTSSTFHRK